MLKRLFSKLHKPVSSVFGLGTIALVLFLIIYCQYFVKPFTG